MKEIHLNEEELLKKRTDIITTINTRAISISTATIVAGGAALYTAFTSNDPSSTLSTALIVAGVILIVLAVARLASNFRHLEYTPTQSVLYKGSEYFENDKLSFMKASLEHFNAEAIDHIKLKDGGNGRIDFMISADGNFAAVQLFSYVPYIYERASDIYYFTDREAHTIARMLRRK